MITILNLSRRLNGICDHICATLTEQLELGRTASHTINTRELDIGFCNNCRACMATPGNDIGVCHLNDDMSLLVASILESDCVVVVSPVNCYDLPSIARIILERMSIFCHWGDDMYSPAVRDTGRDIRGILITTSALPGIMVPLLTRVRITFKLFAKPLRLKPIRYYHLGFKGRKVDNVYNQKDIGTVRKIAGRLISG